MKTFKLLFAIFVLSCSLATARAELLDQGLNSVMEIIDKAIAELNEPPAEDGSEVDPEALENATAAIINLAEAFAAQDPRPRRSLLVLACAAEEGGINGSKWFVAKPSIARNRLVANFNIDMAQIFGVTTDLAVLGADAGGPTRLGVVADGEGLAGPGIQEQREGQDKQAAEDFCEAASHGAP